MRVVVIRRSNLESSTSKYYNCVIIIGFRRDLCPLTGLRDSSPVPSGVLSMLEVERRRFARVLGRRFILGTVLLVFSPVAWFSHTNSYVGIPTDLIFHFLIHHKS